MNLPIEAAVPLVTLLGWVAGVGTALVCRPARSAGTRREPLRDPRGWRLYAPVSRPRHANSDNGAATTARPPIEPQGQAPVKPAFPPPREIREGFTAEETQPSQQQAPIRSGWPVYGNLRPWSELKAELLAHQANVARIQAEQANVARIQAEQAHDMPQPASPPQVQVREPYSPSHVAECGGPCERICICDCGNPPNLPAPGEPLHPAPQANS